MSRKSCRSPRIPALYYCTVTGELARGAGYIIRTTICDLFKFHFLHKWRKCVNSCSIPFRSLFLLIGLVCLNF